MTGDDAALRGTSRTDLTVADMRAWLRNWVANATAQPPEKINETAPLIELGLSSRDAVAMASDIEDYTGVTLSATVAFRHPTIEALATVIIEGEPVVVDHSGDEDWSREADVDDIAVVGLATRFPGDMNSAEETWTKLLAASTRSPTCRRAAGASSCPSRASPSGSAKRAPAAATCPTSRVSTPSSSRCRRWKPTTSTRSSGWRSN